MEGTRIQRIAVCWFFTAAHTLARVNRTDTETVVALPVLGLGGDRSLVTVLSGAVCRVVTDIHSSRAYSLTLIAPHSAVCIRVYVYASVLELLGVVY